MEVKNKKKGSEIYPCPFCGKRAILAKSLEVWVVYCSSNDNCMLGDETFIYSTRLSAIKAWNKRDGQTNV